MVAPTIPGPDPNPIAPTLKLPANACDAHCHIFGPGDRFPYHPDRAYTPPDAPKERLKALHDHLGIERAVIVHASCHGPDMDATLDAIAASGGRYRGTSIVDPDITDAELQRLHDGGIRAVRFNFVKHLESVPAPARGLPHGGPDPAHGLASRRAPRRRRHRRTLAAAAEPCLCRS